MRRRRTRAVEACSTPRGGRPLTTRSKKTGHDTVASERVSMHGAAPTRRDLPFAVNRTRPQRFLRVRFNRSWTPPRPLARQTSRSHARALRRPACRAPSRRSHDRHPSLGSARRRAASQPVRFNLSLAPCPPAEAAPHAALVRCTARRGRAGRRGPPDADDDGHPPAPRTHARRGLVAVAPAGVSAAAPRRQTWRPPVSARPASA